MKDDTMNFLDRLRILMSNNGDNNSSLAKKSGIPYTTIDGLFKRGWEKAQISTIQKICDYYSVSLDYMVYGAEKLSTESLMMAAKYEAASEYGKTIIKCVLNQESEYAIIKKIKVIEMADPSKMMVEYLHGKRQKEMGQALQDYEIQLDAASDVSNKDE